MSDKEENLRPRFKIEKTRIHSSDEKNDKTSFSPDKVIYVEIDDEITNVFDRVKHARQKKIALVIPKRAIILQSIVNLKILKKKIDEIEKEILIVTADIPGFQLAKKSGIAVTERLFEKKPVQNQSVAPVHPVYSQRPTRVVGDKVSISQVIRNEKLHFFASLINRVKEQFKRKKQNPNATRLVFVAPNKQALFTLILISILLLLAIAYIALPGATITITPKSSILDPAFNVTFLDYNKNIDIIKSSNDGSSIIVGSFLVSPPAFTKKYTRNATGKISKGEDAHGIITVTNTSNNPWDLAPKTRFQTDDGLVFRIQNAVRIPGARGSISGTLDVEVISDPYDIHGQVVGIRGNIGPSRFFLPGIKNEENKKKLYGESKNPMTGGTTQTIKIIMKEDIEAAKANIIQDITKNAVDDLKKYMEQQNLVNKTNLSILADRNLIKIDKILVIAPDNLIGTNSQQFEVTANYSLRGIAFDRQELISVLKKRLLTRIDPDKKIASINEDDISYKFLDEDLSIGKVRLTATLRAVQIYELDPEKENGHRFIKKVTDHIVGMRIKDAQEYLLQQVDEVARVEVSTWPMWAPTIPTIADNIKFVIKDETEL